MGSRSVPQTKLMVQNGHAEQAKISLKCVGGVPPSGSVVGTDSRGCFFNFIAWSCLSARRLYPSLRASTVPNARTLIHLHNLCLRVLKGRVAFPEGGVSTDPEERHFSSCLSGLYRLSWVSSVPNLRNASSGSTTCGCQWEETVPHLACAVHTKSTGAAQPVSARAGGVSTPFRVIFSTDPVERSFSRYLSERCLYHGPRVSPVRTQRRRSFSFHYLQCFGCDGPAPLPARVAAYRRAER